MELQEFVLLIKLFVVTKMEIAKNTLKGTRNQTLPEKRDPGSPPNIYYILEAYVTHLIFH